MKNLILKISGCLFVSKCVGCGETIDRELFMCDRCAVVWSNGKNETCRICSNTCGICECIPELLDPSALFGVEKPLWIGFYESPDADSENTFNSRIIYKFKRTYSKKLVRFFALEMSARILSRIRESDIPASEFVVVYAPRSREALGKYGFDHSRKLAEEISIITGIPCECVIKRKTGTVQKNLGYAGRIKNASVSYAPVKPKINSVNGKYAVLIDDIITTGATMSACAEILLNASAAAVIPAAILKVKEK